MSQKVLKTNCKFKAVGYTKLKILKGQIDSCI